VEIRRPHPTIDFEVAALSLAYEKRMGDRGWIATLAVRPYERAGMRIFGRADVWRKELRPCA
jgi:hypothetical protein